MGLLAALLSTASVGSAREPFTIPTARPASIKEVKEVLRGGGAKPPVTDYLEETMCGGWDKEIDVGKVDNFQNAEESIVSGFMSRVVGVPGRQHWWSGDITSGMGARYDSDDPGDSKDDEYTYPETAEGLTTVCEKGRRSIHKDVWEFTGDQWEEWDPVNMRFLGWVPQYELRKHEYQYPYFEDPACRWRMEGDTWPNWPLTPDGPILNSDKKSHEFEEPPVCKQFCQYLNSFVYEDCLDAYKKEFWSRFGNLPDGTPNFAIIEVWTCDPEDRGLRYICSDERVDVDDWWTACDRPHPDLEEWANSRYCKGDQCRCGTWKAAEGGVPQAETSCLRVKNEPELAAYQSYYRHYSGVSYSRSRLDTYVKDDENSKSMDVACYGFYNEFDPKLHATQNKDRRCVINVDVENMRESQKGKGEYKESDVKDKDPTDTQNQRPGGTKKEPTAPGNFDKEKDTWYKKLGGAFSFVNEKLFSKDYAEDLSNVYLDYDALDEGQLKATAQISDEEPVKLFAESNLMRAFDDTGNPRAYTRWWQEQQTRMAAIMRAPVLRVVLPSAWFVGLDPNDPFLVNQSGSADADERANRSDRIELQIEADEDVLGTALAYIERSVLLHVEEEPIPVVVPMGSPADFRARAADWCAWYRTETGEKNCDDAPEELQELMEKLEQYAQRIDDVRELRAELAESAGAMLELQSEILKPIATWFKQNETTLRQLIKGRERVERELLPLWKMAQGSVREMHERTNLPWCMNQRFTAPILSMLDSWLPSRNQQSTVEINEKFLPLLPVVPRPEDVIIDFSAVAAMSGVIKIPVLKPVQIRIEIPTPPVMGELADLPSIQGIRDAMDDVLGNMPRVENKLDNATLPKPPPPLSEEFLNQARNALVQIESLTKGMNDRYKKYWASIGPLKPLDGSEPDFEQQQKDKDKKQLLRCEEWNTTQCQHVEMDLWERIQRIGSRPLVQLKQDFLSVGTKRYEATVCLPEDDACHILNAERTDPGFRWEIRGSRANDAPIDELKLKILELTQPPPLGNVDPKLLQPHDDDPAPLQSFPRIQLLP